MKVVQDLFFGQTRRELPFTVLLGQIGIYAPSGVADGMPLQVMEPDSDTPI